MNKRNWWIIGGIVGVVVLLCCAAGVVAGVAYLNRESPERVVDTYLAAVRDKDRAKAESMTCEGLRRGAAGKLAGLAQNWSEIVEWEIEDVRRGERSAEVKTRVVYKVLGVATTGKIAFTVTQEKEGWRICGFKLEGLTTS